MIVRLKTSQLNDVKINVGWNAGKNNNQQCFGWMAAERL
jgi:hypothetical protein